MRATLPALLLRALERGPAAQAPRSAALRFNSLALTGTCSRSARPTAYHGWAWPRAQIDPLCSFRSHRHFSSARILSQEASAPGSSSGGSSAQTASIDLQPRLSLTFTCTVQGCGHRSTHEFSKRSYQKGIVLVQCPGCKNRHLIADHLGWFKDSHEARTVEDMVRAHGGRVRRGTKYAADGEDQGETIEIEEDSHAPQGQEQEPGARL